MTSGIEFDCEKLLFLWYSQCSWHSWLYCHIVNHAGLTVHISSFPGVYSRKCINMVLTLVPSCQHRHKAKLKVRIFFNSSGTLIISVPLGLKKLSTLSVVCGSQIQQIRSWHFTSWISHGQQFLNNSWTLCLWHFQCQCCIVTCLLSV